MFFTTFYEMINRLIEANNQIDDKKKTLADLDAGTSDLQGVDRM